MEQDSKRRHQIQKETLFQKSTTEKQAPRPKKQTLRKSNKLLEERIEKEVTRGLEYIGLSVDKIDFERVEIE